MLVLQFDVPWPPTLNHCYVTTRHGRRVLTREAAQYRERVAAQVLALRQAEGYGAYKSNNPLIIEAVYYRPDRRRRDTDNIRKVLADAIAKGLGCDDSLFLWRDITSRIDRERPRVQLCVIEVLDV